MVKAPELAEVTWGSIRRALNRMATDGGVWAGAPVPIETAKLVVEKRYPYQGLNGVSFGDLRSKEPEHEPKSEQSTETYTTINSWTTIRRDVTIIEVTDSTGKRTREKIILPIDRPGQSVDAIFKCMDVAMHAWTVDAEFKALELLATLIKPHLFDAYMLTGAFMETSKRSKVTYLFRKLRPTLALSNKLGHLRVLCGLCLHPVGYYQGTFAGCMVPTDDVIAHLMMMRGDEHKFWGMANQFNPMIHGLSCID